MRAIDKVIEVTYSRLDLNASYGEVNTVLNDLNNELISKLVEQGVSYYEAYDSVRNYGYKVVATMLSKNFNVSMLNTIEGKTVVIRMINYTTGDDIIFVIAK